MDESKRQLWEERFEEQSNSEMTIDAWCSQNQISKHTFYYWKQRIQKDKMDRVEKNTVSPLFAKLEMPATAAERITEAGLIIRWRSFEMVLTDHHDISLATQFIRQLSQS